MKCLIVDNEPVTYRDFVPNLERACPGIKVKYAASAPEAASIVPDFKPEMIILDQVMGGGENNGTGFLRWLAKHHSHSPYPQIIFVTGHCEEIPAWQILDTGVPIALFLQKGPSFSQMLLIAAQLLLRKMDGIPRYTPEGLFGDKFIELIMGEVRLIEREEHAGYLTINQQQQISTLIRSYMTSLKTRSHWDGDDILEVSIFFAEGLSRVFDLPLPLIEVLRRFLNIEEILYTIPHYRDHFFHQIKVFLLGFCIVNTLNRNNRLSGTVLAGSDGMKLWFMAAAFHDIGYPFEKMSKWLGDFIKGILRSPRDTGSEAIDPLTFHWGSLLGRRFHAYHLERIVERVCVLYERKSPEVFSEILSETISGAIDRADHGLFSSLIVQNFLGGNLKDEEILPVALSIALHNAEVAQVVRRVIGIQSFQRDPLSFLLAFCDLAQDWGRTKPLGLGRSGYQEFGYPLFDSNSVYDCGSGAVRVALRYERSLSVSEVSKWRTEVFYKHIRPVRDWWNVGPAGHDLPHFCIEYLHHSGPLEQLEF